MIVVAVGGAPASGKSALFRELMTRTGGELKWHRRQDGLVVWHQHAKLKAAVLGDYSDPGSKFSGTDRLSMAVQPQAVDFLRGCAAGEDFRAVLFEGDRLWNNSFFDTLEKYGLRPRLVELLVKEDVLARRHQERGDTQTGKWLAGRATKLANIRARRHVERRPNGDRAKLEANVDYLLQLVGLAGDKVT